MQKPVSILPIKLAIWIFLFGSGCLYGQENSSAKKFQDQFNAFKQKNSESFSQFVNQNDSIFADFLAKSWKEYDVLKAKIRPVHAKPQKPVLYQGDSIKSIEIQPAIPVRKKESLEKMPGRGDQATIPKLEIPSKAAAVINLAEFYGRPLPEDLKKSERLPDLKDLSAKEISGCYLATVSKPTFQIYQKQLADFSTQWQIKDWAFYQLALQTSNFVYQDTRGKIFFTWLSLRKSGFQTRLAYSADELYLLLAFDGEVYNHPFIKLDSVNYYVFSFPGQKELMGTLYTYKDPPSTNLNKIRLVQNRYPDFSWNPRNRKFLWDVKDFSLENNLQLIDFLSTYPECEFEVSLKTPIHPETIKQLDRILLPLLADKNDTERVRLLLSFVQNVIPYQTDEQQFGRENYLFADEVLYYPAADCEDRVALLGQLISYYTKCRWIGLDYPGHVSMAVALPQAVSGAYLNWMSARFTVCDPSYIGSPLGGLMSTCQNMVPKIIE